MKRCLDLVLDHRYNSHCQCVLKALKLNVHWNLADMKRLLPALEASGFFLSTTEFTILSRTIGLQGWVSDVVCTLFLFFHDGITFERF